MLRKGRLSTNLFIMTSQKIILVLLPGLDGTGLVFEPLLRSLPQEIVPRVVHYPCDHPLSFAEHVDFARGELPCDQPFVLLAESFSGPVGLQLLAVPPENLLGVIFVATFARSPSPLLLAIGRYLPPRLLRTFFSTTLLSRYFCLGKAPQDRVDLFRQALQSAGLNAMAQRLRILAELPPPPATAFARPCLYLQAENDRLVPPGAVEDLRVALPQLQVQRLPGPHIILLAEPEAGARVIGDFIFQLNKSGEASATEDPPR